MSTCGVSSRASLLRLPLELQKHIISHLADSGSFTSTHALLLTCKHFYEIALPYSVQAYASHPGRHWADNPRSRNRTLQFLRLITITKAELASHVRELSLHAWTSAKRETDDTMRINEDEWPVYKGIIHSTFTSEHWNGTELRSKWIDGLNYGIEDASIALLLVACPNIKTLAYPEPEYPSMFLSVLYNAVMERRIDKMPSECLLANLRHVKQVPGEDPPIWIGFEMINSWPLLLSNITVYHGFRVTIPESSCITIDLFSKRSSNLETLALVESSCDARAFKSITRNCKALRTFQYTRHPYRSDGSSMTPRDIMDSLLQHADTLEQIYIDSVSVWSKYAWEPTPDWSYMGIRLRQLTRLKLLVVVVQVLTGLDNFTEEYDPDIFKTPPAPPFSECVPEQIEHLEIRSCSREDLPQLTSFTQVLRNKDRFPRLETLRFTFIDSCVTKAELDSLGVNRDGLTFEAGFNLNILF
ncbi:hypothetical protein FBEOM_14122 [Fusarium beomiforme]|uniref:F-box domain-containing protein n=1 Tax=Fusarium beomiforme TaxID=44412 RepID=A0A9P5A4C7_9HYPO|nr:hypothetical protein FBEOM_14122 [Fusarium beomiforme]